MSFGSSFFYKFHKKDQECQFIVKENRFVYYKGAKDRYEEIFFDINHLFIHSTTIHSKKERGKNKKVLKKLFWMKEEYSKRTCMRREIQ